MLFVLVLFSCCSRYQKIYHPIYDNIAYCTLFADLAYCTLFVDLARFFVVVVVQQQSPKREITFLLNSFWGLTCLQTACPTWSPWEQRAATGWRWRRGTCAARPPLPTLRPRNLGHPTRSAAFPRTPKTFRHSTPK